MTRLDSVLKSTDITLPTKISLIKAMVFPIVMYRCESWTIKKTEHWRIDTFELWCWRRLLTVPRIAGRSNQSTLKEINLEYSSEGLMLKLKLQYFGYLMQRADSLEKTLMLGKKAGGEGDDRGWDGWMASPTRWTWVWANCGRWWRTGRPGVLQSMGSQRVRGALVIEQTPPAGFLSKCLQGAIPTRSRVSASEFWLLLFLSPGSLFPQCVFLLLSCQFSQKTSLTIIFKLLPFLTL